jgi:predicted dehydrogenase
MKAMVIGLGRVGFSYSTESQRGFSTSHVGAYLFHPDIDTVIGVDTDKEKLEEAALWDREIKPQYISMDPINKKTFLLYSDYVDAIKEQNPEIVSVCVPTPAHYTVMKDICHPMGPDLICLEKPVAESNEKADMIANRAAYIYGLTEQKRPRVIVNFTRRWDQRWIYVKNELEKRIGHPLVAIGMHPGPLLRTGVHMIDLFNWFFGRPITVTGKSNATFSNWLQKKFPETDDWNGDAEILYPNGVQAFLIGAYMCDVDYQHFEIQIYGSRGAMIVSHNGGKLEIRPKQESDDYGGLPALASQLLDLRHMNKKTPMQCMIDDLVECVKTPKRMPACSVEDGINAQLVVSMIRQSNLKPLNVADVDVKEVIHSH